MLTSVSKAVYGAARRAVAVADLSDCGWLRMAEPDRLDFLQRLSTNDFRGLDPGRGLPTVLASPTGRVIALLITYAGDDAVLLRTMPGQATGVVRYFNSMIFWQDQVEVSDLSAATAQFGLYGPASQETLAALTGESLEGVGPYGWLQAQLASWAVTLHRGGELEVQDWTVVTDRDAASAVWAALTAIAPMLDAQTAEVLRVERGLPAWGRELSGEVTPLETNLTSAISFTKGCYTGQEVIARQVNYDKVTRRLVGLFLPEDAPDDLAGARVETGGGRAGVVSSVAWSPGLGQAIALAIVSRDAAQPGDVVTVIRGDERTSATVATLPFT